MGSDTNKNPLKGPTTKFKVAGGSPAAGYFILLAQNKVTKQKGTLFAAPVGFLRFIQPAGRLINSHDTLRGHVLKHIRLHCPRLTG